ncbi:unnamed protein product [Calicophoron daubneyi]|uniref:Hepatocyte growth factor-regulated tyrosine kinase substrate helical domain-containing protein n=1 Tax=Calicophoron daubneyi TaxID=300641 RepID=A0AAV2TH70_CALDB
MPKISRTKQVPFRQSSGTNQDKQAKEKKVSTAKEEEARREKERQDLELQAREQEELQLALALSASEAECKEKERRGYSQSTRPAADSSRQAENGPLHLLPVLDTSEMDPELARYLNRNYWENRANALNQNAVGGKSTQDGHPSPPMPQPSAPIYASPVPPPAPIQMPAARTFSNSVKAGTMDTANHGATEDGNIRNNTAGVCLPGVPELTTQKQEEFLNALRASIEFFVNRMQSNNQRGRSIANDTTVQALFLTLHEMHPQLLQQKQAMEERRAYFEGLQDKLSQLREAREALDALRLDHAARRQMEEQEAARLRQLQMMQKLEIMRQQKRTTLEYKRRMALEQTMQYQQKYQLQHQPNMQSVDPVTGLPLTLPMTTYQSPNYPVAYPPPNIRPTEAGYAPGQMMANYGPSPDLSSPYGQPPISEDPAYYQPQLQQQQPPPAQPPQTIPGAQTTSGMYYNAQSMGQQAPIPGSYATSSAGPYSMQRLEASLPPTGTQSEIVGAYQMSDNPQLYSTSEAAAKPMETYSGQPNQPTVEIHPSSTGLPTQIAPAYPQQQPPQQASPILKQQPQQQEQQAQSRHQPQSTTEGQLISFD